MTRRIAAALLALALLGPAGPALACSCAAPSGTPAELTASGAVVVRALVTGEEMPAGRPKLTPSNLLRHYALRIEAGVNYAGPAEIRVATPLDGAACGARLGPGPQLVRLYGAAGDWQINLCGQVSLDVGRWDALLAPLPE
ncbi:hypothetical protein LNKW23_35380 [Paralimibaculum aggregatum]|uniref:Uncharacterized protein n=1 Tax=Paralimibaculum aggregatum TaxID=3036245 RepID=A0ABQ6LRL0_9RHOB|nr:hypothetical protein [Limibaculum sp. NKW23]GMG84323.1 hypothetical protein LNKW23_35380 [Limibaculum sp. NKW23]